ncbi:MAG: hypothetical protein LC721_10100 [Actinobacteria bacterium]|nr:hypothetical protein [Actinomycetota bacterium]
MPAAPVPDAGGGLKGVRAGEARPRTGDFCGLDAGERRLGPSGRERPAGTV